jgi:CDP-diglyceride synthetase
MNWNRILSALLSVVYIVAAFTAVGAEGACKTFICIILPIACIWFADILGSYVGPNLGGNITVPSPAVLVCILGWVLLLLPFVIWIVGAVSHSKS